MAGVQRLNCIRHLDDATDVSRTHKIVEPANVLRALARRAYAGGTRQELARLIDDIWATYNTNDQHRRTQGKQHSIEPGLQYLTPTAATKLLPVLTRFDVATVRHWLLG